jgi:hypothetical protein
LPVRERLIPKPGGKQRRLGIATIRDRVVQAACKLVLEPIWEADFAPCSYGFRPGRRAQDAIEEIRLQLGSKVGEEPSTPRPRSTSRAVRPSTPAVRAPLLPRPDAMPPAGTPGHRELTFLDSR